MSGVPELEDYKYGFHEDVTPVFDSGVGLSEEVVRTISKMKNEPEWMLEYRLEAFRAWQKMEQPDWAHLNIPPIDYQDIYYYAAPKKKENE